MAHRVISEPVRRESRSVVPVAVAVAVALGALAVVADAVPGPLGRILLLVASTGVAWGVAAFALGTRATRPATAALAGGIVMVGAVVVYYAAAQLLDLRPASGRQTPARAAAVWGGLGLVAGPVVGLLGWYAVRTAGRVRSAVWGVAGGLLLSQGLYLLLRSRGGVLDAEAGPLRLLLLLALPLPVVLVVAGARRRHVGTALVVAAAVGGAGALAWSRVLDAV